MRHALSTALWVAAATAALSSAPCHAIGLTVTLPGGALCADNAACDGDPIVGVMSVNSPTFSGSVREVGTGSSYMIVASPVTLGAPAGTVIVSGRYGAFIGPGVLRASVSGALVSVLPGRLTTGTEAIGVASVASSFDSSPAVTSGSAAVGLPLPFPINGLGTREGNYNGGGTLTGTLAWRGLAADELFVLPNSAEFLAAVPEPAPLWLIGAGLLAGLARARRSIFPAHIS